MPLTEADKQRIDDINTNATARYNAINTNADLSTDAKTRNIARAYLDQKDAIDAVAAASNGTLRGQIQRLTTKIYGIPTGADSLSYRDALDRTSTLDPATDPAAARKAMDLLDQARLTGDDLLTRAVLKQAFDQQWADVIDAWSDENPTRESDAQNLWDALAAERRNTSTNFMDLIHLYVRKPDAIANLDDYAARQIAANEPTNRF